MPICAPPNVFSLPTQFISAQARPRGDAVKIEGFGGSPRIHAGEERFSAPKKRPLYRCSLAMGLLGNPPATTFHCVLLRDQNTTSRKPQLLRNPAKALISLQRRVSMCRPVTQTIFAEPS
jgi:hypothetical protein